MEKDDKNNPIRSTSLTSLPPRQPVSRPGETASTQPTGKQRLAAMVLLTILSVTFGFVGGYFGDQASEDGAGGNQQAQRQQLSDESQLITQIAEDVGESVVSIDVTSRGVQDTVFGTRAVTRASAGTGIIIDKNGTIITNRHVIPANATSVSVTLSDGTEFENVGVIGRTGENDPLDIAFLQVKDTKGKNLKAAKLGDSSKVEVGQRVIAIGNALGQFQNTVTEGIISGYGRSVEAGDQGDIETLQNLFQTDAAINEGNSGGPLVNINGEVIGINTAVAGNAQNIGFAIPINDAQGLVKSVLKDGKLQRPYLGVRYISLTDEYAFQFNLSTKRGAYIIAGNNGQSAVVPGSPAEKAGLREKDIITKIGNDQINEDNSLISVLGRHSPGETVKLTIVRDGKERSIDVTLGSVPQS